MSNLIASGIIERRIFFVRGEKVMLDRHLAELYGVETRALNQAVRRNIERFPDGFMFKLTRAEIGRVSQIVTSLKFSKSVFAFTEHGVAMLSSVLRSRRAIQVNIQIIKTFVEIRRMLAGHKEVARKLDAMEKKYDAQFKVVFDAIRRLMLPPNVTQKRIGF